MSFPQYYKLLNIPNKATQDQIRQAYKKESLKTHPDRLPGGATPAQKKAATEKFQAVADAYYVLSDATRRKEYDHLYGSRSSQRPSGFGNAGTSSNGFPGGFSSTGNAGRKQNTSSAPGFEADEEEEEEDEYDESSQHEASGNFFKTFASMFGNATGFGGSASQAQGEKEDEKDPLHGGRPDANGVFGDVFEDMQLSSAFSHRLAPEVANVRPFWSYVGGAAGGVIGYIVGNAPGAVAGGLAGNRLGAIRDAKGKSVAQVFSNLGSSQKAEILRALAFKVLGTLS
ncbi:hypothetical protein QFC21_002881 [Naganishia friedmannii]|uniref:Uncharacterized protein n=1 Tax=Naganishia friedmannii TaxID=89922 RepID=A0ACC2VUL6_9TREE|nr:hypothetical protein QFC21_002881 [Naganishia friedmannii]